MCQWPISKHDKRNGLASETFCSHTYVVPCFSNVRPLWRCSHLRVLFATVHELTELGLQYGGREYTAEFESAGSLYQCTDEHIDPTTEEKT